MSPQDVLDGLLRLVDDAHDGSPVFGTDWIADWAPGLLDELLASDLLQSAEPARFVRCPGCQDDHVEGVEYVSYANGVRRPFVSCPELGRALVVPETLLRWRVDGAGLARAIRESLGLSGHVSEKVPGRVWRLGYGQFGDATATVFLVRGLGWADPVEVPAEQGLRIVLSAGDAPSATFPEMIVAGLPDLASWSGGTLIVDRDALDARTRVVTAAAPPVAPYVFRREGEHWWMVFEGKAAEPLGHRVGFETIAELLARPHEPIPARMLMLAVAMRGGAPAPAREDELRADDLALDMVDTRAIVMARARLAEIDRDLHVATDGGPRYEKLQEDRRRIQAYLRQVSNHRGKPRKVVDDRERARNAVGKRIRTSIAAIGPQLPALAVHLRKSIQAGYDVVYQPDGGIKWVLR